MGASASVAKVGVDLDLVLDRGTGWEGRDGGDGSAAPRLDVGSIVTRG